jgi:hypothetical protein
MMNARLVSSVLLALGLTACVAPPAPDPNGSPARLILDPLLTRRNASAGVLSVRRDATTTADPCRHRIFLDGNPVADLRPNEVINIYAPPGPHMLRAEQTGSSCHGGNEIAAASEPGRWRRFITTAAAADGALLIATAQ